MRPNPQALADQLLLLTLATEQAIVSEDWAEVDGLFVRREDILDKLGGLPIAKDVSHQLEQIQRLEGALLGRLESMRSSVVGQIIQERRQGKAAQLYKQAS